ncbi:hypothetical protein [Gimesia chilikensis]|uniref:hypothetical protein n=1 Tax=Gimesia chilikensis TaxID=2605989 RepID=UPI003A95D531
MPEKIWIGGAPANAQQVKYELPLDIEGGQVMTAKIGLKEFSYTFPGGPIRVDVVAAFVDLWEDKAAEIREFELVNITDNLDGSFTLTSAVPGAPFIASILIGSGTNEKQTVTLMGTITGGSFKLTFDGQQTGSIAYNASAATIQTELEGLSNIEVGDVAVTGDDGGPWTIEFKGLLADTDVALLEVDDSLLEATNEQQTISLASCTGGTFALGFGGDTTDPIAYNASAATIQTELEALPSIGAGNVSVSGAGPWVVEFIGDLRGTNVDSITVDGSNLTGVLAATITETTPGGNGVNERWYLSGAKSGIAHAYGALNINGNASVSGGTFDLLIQMDGNTMLDLNDIPYDITLAGLQELIEGSSTVGSGGAYAVLLCVRESAATGTGQLSDGDDIYLHLAAGADYNVSANSATITIDSTNLTGGTYGSFDHAGGGAEWGSGFDSFTSFYIKVGDQTTDDLDNGATLAEVTAAVEGLSNVGTGNVTLTQAPVTKDFAYLLEFIGDLANQDTGLTVEIGSNSDGLNTAYFKVLSGSGGTSEVQTLSISGSPVSGTFALQFNSVDTALLGYDSTAAEIQTALEGVLGVGNVTCSGGDLPGSDVLITFAGSKAGIDVADIAVIFGIVTETVTGGGNPYVKIDTIQTILSVTTLQESEGPNDWNTAANWDTGTVPEDGDTVIIPNGPDILYGLDQSGLSLAVLLIEDSDTEVGLPYRTDDDELEYLPRFLKLSADQFIIGQGPGGGSERINIEPVNTDAEIIVYQSSTGQDDEEAVMIRNVNSANTVTLMVIGGEVGIATGPKDEAYIKKITQRGGTLHIGSDVGLEEIDRSGGQISSYQATLNGLLTL